MLAFLQKAPSLILALFASAAAANTAEQTVASYLVKEKALPAHSRWHEANQAFLAVTEQFCVGKKSLATTQDRWREAQQAWLALQPSLVSPAVRNAIGMQAYFWPDKRDLASRQTEELIAGGENPTVDMLKKGSVVVRGLSSSEYLLFDPKSKSDVPAARTRLCPLLLANAAFQNALSLESLQLLKEQRVEQMLTQVPNEQYPEINSVLAELLRVHVAALAMMNKKLSVVVNQSGDAAMRRYQAEAWRSDNSLAGLESGIAASRAHWESKGWRSLVQARNNDLAFRIDTVYLSLQNRLEKKSVTLAMLLDSDSGRQQLNDLYADLLALHLLYEKEVSNVLGIQLGFNGTDGD